MCMICLDLEKLTTLEAARNLGEIAESLTEQHLAEVLTLIAEKGVSAFPESSIEDSEKAFELIIQLVNKYFK